MELWEQIEFSLLSLKHRLRKRDELQNKLDLFSKEREIEILAEIQENRNKVYKLEETMKQNLYTSAPAEQRNPRGNKGYARVFDSFFRRGKISEKFKGCNYQSQTRNEKLLSQHVKSYLNFLFKIIGVF